MTTDWRFTLLALLLATSAAWTAAAQSTTAALPVRAPRPSPVIEGAVGWAGFVDEDVIHHTLGGLGARFHVTRRLSLGPEVAYMIGPGSDRDLLVTGNVMLDLLAPAGARPRLVTPFLVAGVGLFRHSDSVGNGTFASSEGAFTMGAGARTWLTPRTFLAVDARMGWEPHVRLAAIVGVSLKPRLRRRRRPCRGSGAAIAWRAAAGRQSPR